MEDIKNSTRDFKRMLLPFFSSSFRYRRGDYLASASERGAVLFITPHRGDGRSMR